MAQHVLFNGGMTRARRIIPGMTHFISRRCLQRRFLLRPDKETNLIIRFCLARAARRYGVRLHAFVFMSNHLHLLLTDDRGELPAFMQYLGQLLARAINAQRGRCETFWAPGSYDDVLCLGPEAFLALMVYIIVNPVIAGLVSASNQWPGVISLPSQIGTEQDVARPAGFFRKNGPLPSTETLRLDAPDHLASEDLPRFIACLQAVADDREAKLRALALLERRPFLGRGHVQRVNPLGRPSTAPPSKHRKLVAADSPDIRDAALAQLTEFQQAYARARQLFLEGNRETVFPAGTYALRVFLGVRCAAAG